MPPLKFVGDKKDDQKRPKKQKLVKHRRKNWAKTDISDVERRIDDLNRQKLAGGVLADKKDEELFVINKKPTVFEDVDQEEGQYPRKKGKKSLEEKLNNLACYRNLKPDVISAPAHVVGHRKSPDPESKRQAKLTRLEEKKAEAKKRKSKNSEKSSQAKKPKLSGDKFDICLVTNSTEDIWNPDKASKKRIVENDYLKPAIKVPIKRPENPLTKVESRNPKIVLPHPGMSYNPDFDDHQELLLKAHEIELKKLKKEEKELKLMKSSVQKMTWKQIEELWLKEMSLNQLFEENSLEEKENETAGESTETKAPKSTKGKKEPKKKRKQLLQKIKEKQKELEKKSRIQNNEIFRIKSILKEIKEKETEREENKLKKEIEEKHRELFEPKRLGRIKYEEPDIDIKLSDELTGNLRTLKPEGNILMDSYKQLQKRNIIEPREKASKKGRRKYWKKVFDKRNAHEKTHFIK